MEEKKSILIAEDEPFLVDLYQKVFEKKGFAVTAARNGQEALTRATEASFDIILLDIMMPLVDGMTVLRRLKDPSSPAKDIPIYMLTNLGQESVLKEALRLGAVGYIIKAQYLPNQIVEEVENFLNQRNSNK